MIEAMKLALWHEAMAKEPNRNKAKREKHEATAKFIRQAIAEAEKQEPVMGVEVKRIASGGFIGNVWWIHENLQEGVFHLYTHPYVPTERQPKAEKQEPVAIDKPLKQKRPQNCGTSFCSCIECVMEPEPKPSPLTVDEIWRNDRIMSLNADLGLGIDDWIKIVDAVEAAHGIKENT